MPAFVRDAVGEQLRAELWRYLSGAGRMLPVRGVVESLWGLDANEAHRLLAGRLALGHLADRMLTAAASIAGRPKRQAYSRTVELTGSARGTPNWPRTVQRRWDTGDPTLFVCAENWRNYDNLETQAAKACVTHFSGMAAGLGLNGTQGEEVARRAELAATIRSSAKLRGVQAVSAWSDARLRRLRRSARAAPLAAYLQWVRDGLEGHDLVTVREVLEEALLVPNSDSTLFEYVVGFGVVRALERTGYEVCTLHAVVDSPTPFAVLRSRRAAGRRVTIWRQRSLASVPGFAGSSRYADIKDANGMGQSSLLPDWTVEVDGGTVIPIEVKLYTTDPMSGVRHGLMDMMAYLADRVDLCDSGRLSRGLVVAWDAAATPSAARQIVVCSQSTLDEGVQALAIDAERRA